MSAEIRVLLGPPGTGKTTRLIAEVEKLLDAGAAPYEIAFVSFTNAACNEARDRACDKFHLEPEDLLHFRTMHSMARRSLGRKDLEVMKGRHFKAFGESAACDFADEEESPETGIFRTTIATEGDALLAVWNRSRVSMCSVDEAMLEMRRALRRSTVTPDDVRRFGQKFSEYKSRNSLIDFTDMLEMSLRGGTGPGGVRFAFVDEAQDNNALQHALCRQWFARCERVTYCGDDDQAIFTFCGAKPAYLQDLARQHHAEVLTQSWRIPERVHDLAMSVVHRIDQRTEKLYRPRPDAGEVLFVRDASEAVGLLDGSGFALARNKKFLADFTRSAATRGLYYEVAPGCGPLAATQHKDTLAAYRALSALLRGQSTPAENFHALVRLVPASETDASGAKHPMRLRGSVKRAQENRDLVFSSDAASFFDAEWWKQTLAGRAPFYHALLSLEDDERDHLQRLYDRFGPALPAEPELRVMTEHRCKGLEADTVLVCPDMLWPSYEELTDGDADSEHRLAYVASTRPRQRLVIVEPDTRGRRAMFYPFPGLSDRRQGFANVLDFDLLRRGRS